jgi:WD40 repeat protein
VSSCSWSPDGSRFVSCSADKTVCVWDVRQGECTATLTGHKSLVSLFQLERVWVLYFGSFSVCEVGLFELSLNE